MTLTIATCRRFLVGDQNLNPLSLVATVANVGGDTANLGNARRLEGIDGVVAFKVSLVKENHRFARAFTAHLLRFALARELGPAGSITIDAIVSKAANDDFKLRSLIREVGLSALPLTTHISIVHVANISRKT